jgi:hypothetical protein
MPASIKIPLLLILLIAQRAIARWRVITNQFATGPKKKKPRKFSELKHAS